MNENKNDNIEAIATSLNKESLTNEAKDLLVKAGSNNRAEAELAQAEIAQGIQEAIQKPFGAKETNVSTAVANPIREGVVDGDIVSDIFLSEDFTNTGDMRIPLDLLSPGTEKEHIAYVLPDHGKIPQRRVEADYVMLNTYPIGNSIDCTRNFLRNARFDILRRMIEVLRAGFVKKDNDDGWQTLLAAADGRGLVVFDGDAANGQFTPKLTSLMKTVMRRNGGGNSTSLNRKKLTDMYMAPEAFEDMVSWGLNLIPDSFRETIFRSADGGINGLFGVNFHDIDEFGVGQEYNNYYKDTLAGTFGTSDTTVLIGLDLTSKDKAFMNPVSEPLSVFEDNTLHRHGLVGFYGHKESGWAVLDVRYVLAGSY